MVPANAYGNVVEIAFKQAVARRGGRVVAFERYSNDAGQMQTAARRSRRRNAARIHYF